MKFYEFSQYLQRLENTPKRLEIIEILAELISKLEINEVKEGIYLTLGYMDAPFHKKKLNIADKMMIKILENAYSTEVDVYIREKIIAMYGDLGDLGDVAKAYSEERRNPNLTQSIGEIYQQLIEITEQEGTGSQEAKLNKIVRILKVSDPISAKYIVRIILGTTRLGFTETTIISALAQILGNKSYTKEIEKVYNIHPDIGLIAKKIRENGIKGIELITIEPGVPVLSQKAQRVSGMEEAFERIPQPWLEYKYDGTRVQLHMDRNKTDRSNKITQTELFSGDTKELFIKTYTRNLEETTHQYPDLVEAADKQINAESIILDGEAIGYNPETGDLLPFQETIQRKRKYGVEESAKEIPLRYYIFDILYLNGETLINKPLEERRKILDSVITKGETLIPDEVFKEESLEGIRKHFENAKEKSLEGLIVKSPKDPYQAGARSYSWIKLKTADEKLLDDSIECVLLGYYYGKGTRSKFGIGGFLVGIYDEESEVYKTISKIGTGLKEEDWNKLKELADKVKVKDKPKEVEVDKMLEPDVWTTPKIVVEIGADEITVSPNHTTGYALRFPRLLRFREDKGPTQTTNTEEIVRMFNNFRKR